MGAIVESRSPGRGTLSVSSGDVHPLSDPKRVYAPLGFDA